MLLIWKKFITGSRNNYEDKYNKSKTINNKNGYNYNNLKALLCEDTPFNIKLIQSLLAKLSVELDIAENGKLGIEKLEETK